METSAMNKFERAYILLQVAKMALDFSGLKPLHDEALAELKAMTEAKPVAEPELPLKASPKSEKRI